MTALSRRVFVQGAGAVGLALLAGCGRWPGQAQGQAPARTPRIGILRPVSADNPYTESIRQGLRELGYVEGRNITIEYRFADGQYERLPNLAAELIQLGIDVLVTDGPANRVARDATTTIPIIFALDPDPVGTGLVASVARPSGNVTGLSLFHSQLAGKRLELILQVAPGALHVAVLANPGHPSMPSLTRELESAAQSAGVQLQWLRIQAPSEIPQALGALADGRAHAVLISDDAMFFDQRAQLAEMAAESRLPAIFANRGFADAGGLMAYGPNLHDMFRRSATYVDKIVKGAQPADLPVEQPMLFDFVINLRTAQALGLTIPPHVLLQATEVIQ